VSKSSVVQEKSNGIRKYGSRLVKTLTLFFFFGGITKNGVQGPVGSVRLMGTVVMAEIGIPCLHKRLPGDEGDRSYTP